MKLNLFSRKKKSRDITKHHTHMLLDVNLVKKIDKMSYELGKSRTSVVSTILGNAIKQWENRNDKMEII